MLLYTVALVSTSRFSLLGLTCCPRRLRRRSYDAGFRWASSTRNLERVDRFSLTLAVLRRRPPDFVLLRQDHHSLRGPGYHGSPGLLVPSIDVPQTSGVLRGG